jgi:hypothetical protein
MLAYEYYKLCVFGLNIIKGYKALKPRCVWEKTHRTEKEEIL